METGFIQPKLAKALFNARKEMVAGEVKKNVRGAHNKYADLGSVLDVVNPALEANGILVSQTPIVGTHADGVAVTTILTHVESGEQFSFTTEVRSTKIDPQANGGCITYARRYALMAFFVLVSEDDDAQSAMPARAASPASGGYQRASVSRTSRLSVVGD